MSTSKAQLKTLKKSKKLETGNISDIEDVDEDESSEGEKSDEFDNINDEDDEDNEYMDDENIYNKNETIVDDENEQSIYDEDGNICNNQKTYDDDDDDGYYDNDDELEAQPDTSVVYIKKEDRQSSAKLTKYEMVRILGEREKQLTMGAKPLIKNYKGLSYDKIAEEELKLNMTPFKIRRPLPNGKYELWNIEELYKGHLLSLLE